jgi:hypothetical protein
MKHRMPFLRWTGIFALFSSLFFGMPIATQAEYADVVINRQAEKNGMRPVVFPHWFHRIRFRCKV